MWHGANCDKKRGRTREEFIQNSITKCFMFRNSQDVYSFEEINKNMMGQPCGTYGRVEKCRQRCCMFIVNEIDHLKALMIEGG